MQNKIEKLLRETVRKSHKKFGEIFSITQHDVKRSNEARNAINNIKNIGDGISKFVKNNIAEVDWSDKGAVDTFCDQLEEKISSYNERFVRAFDRVNDNHLDKLSSRHDRDITKAGDVLALFHDWINDIRTQTKESILAEIESYQREQEELRKRNEAQAAARELASLPPQTALSEVPPEKADELLDDQDGHAMPEEEIPEEEKLSPFHRLIKEYLDDPQVGYVAIESYLERGELTAEETEELLKFLAEQLRKADGEREDIEGLYYVDAGAADELQLALNEANDTIDEQEKVIAALREKITELEVQQRENASNSDQDTIDGETAEALLDTAAQTEQDLQEERRANNALRAQLAAQQRTIVRLQAEVENVDPEVERVELEDTLHHNRKLQFELRARESEVEENEARIEALNARIEVLQSYSSETETENDTLRAAFEGKVKGLAAKLKEKDEYIAALKKDHRSALDEVIKHLDTIGTLRKEQKELTVQKEQDDEIIQQLRDLLQQAQEQGQNPEAVAELEKLREQVNDHESAIHELDKLLIEVSAQKNEAVAALRNAQAEIEAYKMLFEVNEEQEPESAQDELVDYKKRLGELGLRLDEERSAKKAALAEVEKLKNRLINTAGQEEHTNPRGQEKEVVDSREALNKDTLVDVYIELEERKAALETQQQRISQMLDEQTDVLQDARDRMDRLLLEMTFAELGVSEDEEGNPVRNESAIKSEQETIENTIPAMEKMLGNIRKKLEELNRKIAKINTKAQVLEEIIDRNEDDTFSIDDDISVVNVLYTPQDSIDHEQRINVEDSIEGDKSDTQDTTEGVPVEIEVDPEVEEKIRSWERTFEGYVEVTAEITKGLLPLPKRITDRKVDDRIRMNYEEDYNILIDDLIAGNFYPRLKKGLALAAMLKGEDGKHPQRIDTNIFYRAVQSKQFSYIGNKPKEASVVSSALLRQLDIFQEVSEMGDNEFLVKRRKGGAYLQKSGKEMADVFLRELQAQGDVTDDQISSLRDEYQNREAKKRDARINRSK